jgi:aspartyl-tRNA(Asn)/glutamyl-tRNA(Gln) amidotransferase subunit B
MGYRPVGTILMARYETVIGLEIHAQLLTRTKLFCSCPVAVGQTPNTHVCPVCLGWPGSLPSINERAVRLAVRAALALGCGIRPRSEFSRKQYFYPDLPKGYQLSQFDQPFSSRGDLTFEVDGETRTAGITRVHIEEDAGKNLHGRGGQSVVDLNRAGTPLIEIVGEPDLRSSAEAAAYMRAVRDILVFAGVNDGNLEEGSLRCDANVSIRPVGQTEFGTRVELKNLNSFRFVQKAIDSEVARQTAILDAGGQVVQETRQYDPDKNITRSLRGKADAHDYRYFPDPDLPPLVLDGALIEEERRAVGELPAQRRARYVSLGVSEGAAATLTSHPGIARFFDQVVELFPHPQKASNWIVTEVLRGTKTHGLEASFPVSAGQVAELLKLVESGDISGKQAKDVYLAIEGTSESPLAVVEARGMRVVSDDSALRPIIQKVIADHPAAVETYRSGKTGTLGFFVGQVMKLTKGSANPKLVSDLLTELLSK